MSFDLTSPGLLEYGLLGGAGLLVLIVIVAILTRDKGPSEEEKAKKLGQIEAKRERDYETAREHRDEALAKLKEKKELVLDFIHDIEFDPAVRDNAPKRISFDEVLEGMQYLREANETLDVKLVLHTLGGFSLPSFMIAEALKNHKGKTTAYVPYAAMSGGTIMALACQKIYMGPTAKLGPIDTVYGGVTHDALERLSEYKRIDNIDDDVLLGLIEAKKYEDYSRKACRDITNAAHKKGGEDDHAVADWLSEGKMSHAQTISFADAKKAGMNVEKGVPREVFDYVDNRVRMMTAAQNQPMMILNLLGGMDDDEEHKVTMTITKPKPLS